MQGVSDPVEIPEPVQDRHLKAEVRDWIFWKTGGVSVTHRARGPWGEGKRLLATGPLANFEAALSFAMEWCAGRLDIDFAEIPTGTREARYAAAEERQSSFGVSVFVFWFILCRV